MIKRSYDRSKRVLEEHIDVLHALAALLLEKETVLGKEMDALILQVKPDIELPARPGDEADETTSPEEPAPADAMD